MQNAPVQATRPSCSSARPLAVWGCCISFDPWPNLSNSEVSTIREIQIGSYFPFLKGKSDTGKCLMLSIRSEKSLTISGEEDLTVSRTSALAFF